MSGPRRACLIALLGALSLLLLAVPGRAQQLFVPNADDRAALKALHAATDGDNWTSDRNWDIIDTATTTQTLYGVIPGADGRVAELWLNSNNLSGSLPADLNKLTSLTEVRFYSNKLTGEIPDLSALTKLTNLNLNANQLTGNISASDLPSSLTNLNISGNQLSGTVPDLSALTKLTNLGLHHNQLTGLPTKQTDPNDPSSRVIALPPSLQYVYLENNQLTGSIPDLSTLTGRLYLSLQNNQLTGSIPALPSNMLRLNLSNNHLTGPIPTPLPTTLSILNLSNNRLTGSLPDLSRMFRLNLNNNRLTGPIPTPLSSSMKTLHLHNNRLTGDLSQTNLGSLSDLTSLSLYGNPGLYNYPAGLNSKSNLLLLAPGDGTAVCLPTTQGGADCTVPTLVDKLRAQVSSTQLTFTWAPNPATPAPSGYTAQYRRGPITTILSWESATVTGTTATARITPTAGATYIFRVRTTDTPNSPQLYLPSTAPVVELRLSKSTVSEGSRESVTVTAHLTRASSAKTTVVVAATALSPAVPADFTLSTNRTLTIAAGATASTGTVTITAVNNTTDAPAKRVMVSGTVTNSARITAPAPVELTISDDDAPPTVTLALSSASISENSGQSTVTATLNHASSAKTTLVVSATAVSPAVAADFTLSTNRTLTIAAGATASTGTVTVTATDNAVDGPERKTVTVSAAGYNAQGVTNASAKTLTITDDDAAAVVTLAVSPAQIAEAGGQSTVTATANRASNRQIVVTVAPVSGCTLSTNRVLTIAAGATVSTGTVTLTAMDNDIDAQNASVPVGGTASPARTVTSATLTITDDDTRGVTITPSALTVNEDTSETYTVVLNSRPTAAVTVGVTTPTNPDVTVKPASLVFQPGRWNMKQTVTVSAADDTDAVDDTATITHSVSGGDYAGESAAAVTVTVEDDEAASTAVVLKVNRTVPESSTGTVVTVTGTLNGATETGDTAVTVSVASGTATVATDFAAVSDFPLTIPAGQKSATATFTLTPVDDSMDEPDETVTVGGSITGGLSVTATTLTIEDNDAPPTVTLVLSPASISELSGQSTVTARLNHTSSEETTVTVSAAAVSPAVSADFTLSTNRTLTIAAESTDSTGTVTITAVNNHVDAPAKQVTVRGQATNAQGIMNPANATLTITDNDPPEVSGPTTPQYTEGGTGPVATYTATNPENVRLTWSVDGGDKDAFTIQNGRLRFQTPPDFEASRSPVYDVRVQASDGIVTTPGHLLVTVTVEDAPGDISLSPLPPHVGEKIMMRLRDPDGIGPIAQRRWYRSVLPTFPQDSTLTLAATPTYTPTEGDLGHYLRATVAYTDGDGTQKEAKRDSSEPVASLPQTPRQPPSSTQPSSTGGGGGGGRGGGGGGDPPPDDRHGDTPDEATDLTPSDYTIGSFSRSLDAHLQSGRDVDYFSVNLPAAGILTAHTTGGADTTGRLYQAQEDGAPLLVTEDTDGGPGRNFRLGAAVEPGTYYLAVSAGRGSGAYTLHVHYTPAFVDNPAPNSPQSGISVLSGWVCDAATVEIEFVTPGAAPQTVVPATHTSRADTAGVCGAETTDTGFGLLFNWNLLGDGAHTVRVLINDVVFAERAITVTTLGDHPDQEFRRGLRASSAIPDFPEAGQTTTLRWEEALQNFVIASGARGSGGAQPTPEQAWLENPAPGSFQSGLGVLSGWVCEAATVEIVFEPEDTDDTLPFEAGSGTERLDTADRCGDSDNGFGLLFNWNLLGDGRHTVRAYADEDEFAHSTVTVTTLGTEFAPGLRQTHTIEDFPEPGQTTTVEWQTGQQNFVVTGVETPEASGGFSLLSALRENRP